MVKGLPAEWGTCTRTVALANRLLALTCWKDTIAVGLTSGDIIILDGITGSQTAILSGHTDWVRSLAFLPDGTSLVSGSHDKTIKLWDVQTGGVVKTFYGHTDYVLSVSISADCTMIASGSGDMTICLWNIQTEACSHVIRQQDYVYTVGFSPTDPCHLTSVSGGKVWHWDINGHQTKPEYDSSHIAFSLNGTWFVFCHEGEIVVQNTDSGAIVAKFNSNKNTIRDCCLSPDGKLIAVAADHATYVWDATSSHPHPIKIFVGHTGDITSLVFSSSSSLISSSNDQSVKFWQIGALETDPVVTGLEPVSLTSTPIASISLQAEAGIAVSSDSEGAVKTWDISTGLCNATFQTPAKTYDRRGVQLVNDRLILIYYGHWNQKLCIVDVEKGKLLQTVPLGVSSYDIEDFKISKDGSWVACLYQQFVRAWSIQMGEVVGEVELEECDVERSLTVDDSGVWVHSPGSEPLGWDFGIPGSPPVQLSNMPLLDSRDTKVWDVNQSQIKDAVTGKVVFQLGGRFANPTCSQWDGQYLVAGYYSGEVFILDSKHVLSW